ncbi:DUF2971 domain-containing protein [Mucilaginibacter aquatilis]|uniref:DUF2971 domain-containing protein n=1 Tax=Mucilaginibacter aquatilis TaxID=1517760 RepID=A0A6I4IR20_9SPHI|nr:DUF2971 domain-containing protein [Mucilaginibacter aquatilis]MVN92034.1 DUF2971 domain-containing protein [Mucilaginibacter aquatilis]
MRDNNAGKAIPINELQVPEVLYKYREFKNEYHVKSITKCQVYLPSANEFNDPFDSKIPFRYNPEELTKENIYLKSLEVAKNAQAGLEEEEYQQMAYRAESEGLLFDSYHLDEFDKNTFNRLCKDYAVFCLTPDCLNLLMWSYYADSHRGFSIGYDAKFLVKCGYFSIGGKIMYTDQFPKMPLFLSENDYPMLNILFTKWNKWEHENEYRLIHRLGTGKIKDLPSEAIKEIVLGCQISNEKKIEYVMMIKEVLPKVDIYEIKMRKDGFGLTKEPIVNQRLLLFDKV